MPYKIQRIWPQTGPKLKRLAKKLSKKEKRKVSGVEALDTAVNVTLKDV